MRVAIIDDGVHTEVVRNCTRCFTVKNRQVIATNNDSISKNSHGTICAKIIENNISDIDLVSISIYQENEYGNEENLGIALEWCKNNNIDLINMSNGAYGYFENEKLNDLCFQNFQNGIYLVAAINNNLLYTSPAHLPYVISVSNRRRFRLYRNRIVKADVVANGTAVFLAPDGKWHIGTYSSFSCARISNKIIRYFKNKGRNHSFFRTIGISNRLDLYNFGLLKNMFCLNNEELIKNYGYSPCEDYKNKKLYDSKTNSLVIAPQSNIDDVVAIIHKNFSKIYSVIWCNKHIPKRLKKLCKKYDIKYWDESVYDIDTFLKNFEITEPIIVIKNSKNSFQIASEITKRLLQDNYKALLFAEEKYSYLYGAIGTVSINKIKVFCEEFEPDIIVIASDSDTLNNYADLLIYSEENILFLQTENGIIELPINYDDIYKKIISQFECENN